MRGAVILTTRKRVIVALAHSVAFLFIAWLGIHSTARAWSAASPPSAWALPGVYLIVSAILAALTALAGNLLERLYFGFCATSAGFGLGRQILGDPKMHAAVYVRVAMLGCAVLTGLIMLRACRGIRLPPCQSSPTLAAPAFVRHCSHRWITPYRWRG
jgi:hypothetical protein